MKQFVSASAIATLLCIGGVIPSVLAQGAAPTLNTVKAGTYTVETPHAQVGFAISHFGFSYFSGLLSGITGSLQLNPADLSAAKLDVSIAVDTLLTTIPKLTNDLKNPQWFDTNKFPNATFASTKVVAGGPGEVVISGNLTLHGVTRPVELRAHFVGAGVNPLHKEYTVGFQATGAIKRSDFGMSSYLPAIGDDVQLTVAAAFELQN